MAIDFPTRQEVIDRSKTDVQTELPDLAPFIRNSLISAMITANAGRAYEFYQQLQAMLLQAFPDTATGQYLNRWGSYVGINQLPAVAASGNVVFTGTVGTLIPTGTQLTYNTYIYTTTTFGTISENIQVVDTLTWQAGVATATFVNQHPFATGQVILISGATPSEYNGLVTITANSDFSISYNLDNDPDGSPATGSITAAANLAVVPIVCSSEGIATDVYSGGILQLASVISGLSSSVYASYDGVVGGADPENTDSFRARILYNYANPVAQFNVSQIIQKAQTVTGVTRVWVEEPSTTPRNLTPTEVTSSGDGTAFLTTAVPHGLTSGSYATISGMSNGAFNKTQVFVLVFSPTTIVYLIAESIVDTLNDEGLLQAATVEPGQVKITFVRDFDTSIIPTPDEVATVKSKILQLKPAHVPDNDVIVVAPTAVPIDFQFSTLTPNIPTMKTAIENTLYEYFRSQNVPNEPVTLISLYGALYNTVDTQTGLPLIEFTLADPNANVEIPYGSIGTLGTVTFDE